LAEIQFSSLAMWPNSLRSDDARLSWYFKYSTKSTV